MYLDYWRFKEKPFENTPDPRFFYCSRRHEEALMRFLYALQERKAAFMLSGEYGSGKTLLSRVVIGRLMQKEDEFKVALIVNPAISALEILNEIVYQLGGDSAKQNQKIDALRQLNDMLYRLAQLNKHVVVIIDEAQAISDEATFEELRLLLNFQTNERFLFTLVLLGQPDLIDKIDRIPQLKQRLALRYHLTTLTEIEARNYIEHRCKVAGREEPVFSDEAHKLIYEYSKGVPRQMNNFCDLSLVIAMGEKAVIIDEKIARLVIHDFHPERAIETAQDRN